MSGKTVKLYSEFHFFNKKSSSLKVTLPEDRVKSQPARSF